jgi:hypothetical protein
VDAFALIGLPATTLLDRSSEPLQIDRSGPHLDEPREKRLLALFEETLAAEIPFHDAAYA